MEKGSRFIAPIKSVTPFDERAVEELGDYQVYYGPTQGYGETVYCMELNSGKKGRTTVMLHNATASRGVAMSYNVDSLPFFTLWKNTDVGEKGYVTGLEPGSGFPYNRSVERERGRVKTIAPGKAKHFHVEVEVLPDGEAVSKVGCSVPATIIRVHADGSIETDRHFGFRMSLRTQARCLVKDPSSDGDALTLDALIHEVDPRDVDGLDSQNLLENGPWKDEE